MTAEDVYDVTYSDEHEEWEGCEGREDGSPAYFKTFMDLDETDKEQKVGSGSRPEGFHVRGVSRDKVVNIILDSGADMFQGRTMKGGDLRQALVVLEDSEGKQVHMRETFALSNAKEPLLAVGKLIKKGWKVSGRQEEGALSYGMLWNFQQTYPVQQSLFGDNSCDQACGR